MATISIKAGNGRERHQVDESASTVVSDVNSALQHGRRWIVLTRDGREMGVRADDITVIRDEGE